MNLVKKLADHVGEAEEKFFKTTLFRSDTLLLGINCLRPGQAQPAHVHDDQDKFYFVVEGKGRFRLGETRLIAGEGEVVWAPAGLEHGVRNDGQSQLTLLVGIAPAP
jgi:mannose-6-phosphate isomerase-like protein (cupin superfamily)